MGDRTLFDQVLSLALVLFFVAGFTALLQSPDSSSDTGSFGQGGQRSGGLVAANVDCGRLITPSRVGEAEFVQYNLADKMADDEFVAHEVPGYIVCSHGQPPEEGLYPEFTDIYYIFSKETGELALTYLERKEALAVPTPSSPLPTPSEPSPAVTICLDASTPLVAAGEDSPEQWDIWDIVGGNCSADMSGSRICFDCGDEVPWRVIVPLAADPEGGAEGSEMVCIDVTTAIVLRGDDPGRAAAPLPDPDRCSLTLEGGEICWSCPEEGSEPVPTPMPAGPAAKEPTCEDYLTPDYLDVGEWNKYAIGDKLRDGYFYQFPNSSNRLVCYDERMLGEAWVLGDVLYFSFDFERGQFWKKIHWRQDLPEELPGPLISQWEAEAMVDGEVSDSILAILPVDDARFVGFEGCFHEPCWLVWGQEGESHCSSHGWTAINALTGEIAGQHDTCEQSE